MASIPPVDVQRLRQSIWYDNISRGELISGEIERLVSEDGVMGITSNPTIFMKAIAGTSHYDEAIATLLDEAPYDIYERLAIDDIRSAADILRPVYERSNKRDGYVSLEVSPFIADDTEQSLAEARRLFTKLDRPNVMIKIPATEAGLPAIEDAIADGININVTLIFSVQNYREVAERYIRGLERRLEKGLRLEGIASVASFFISRIDNLVDQQLENNIRSAQGRDLERMRANRELLGTIAIANAKAAYQAYKGLFQSDRFQVLIEAGAMVQRPLWASTSTKNPGYPDTFYVDNLIGADTVNTMPPGTLYAFKKHGTVGATLEEGVDGINGLFHRLAEAGVDIDNIFRMLQVDGVDAFADSFEKLLGAVEGKREMLKAGVMKRQRIIVGGYEPGLRRTVNRLGDIHANRSIWNKDAAFWKETAYHQESIRNRLGWLFCLKDGSIDRARLTELQADSRQWSHAVLMGMGGSSLAPEVFWQTFGQQAGFPEFIVLDSTDPARVKTVEDQVDLANTVFIVASKSGSTLETDAFRRYFFDKVAEIQGVDKAGQQFIAITDGGSSLAQTAEADGYREAFINPSDIGGRYSAMSYFGLVPAAIMGLDLTRLFASAETMLQATDEIIPASGHPGMWLGALLGHLAQKGHNKLGLLFADPVVSFANWVEQLVAESTGKESVGVLPVVAGTVGKPHDYDDDRFLVYLRMDDTPKDYDQQVKALQEAGHPVLAIQMSDAYDLGGEFIRWEFGTAVAGHVLGINPFDEPNVTESKENTAALLDYFQKHGNLPRAEAFLEELNVALYVDANTGEMLSKICEQRNYSDTELAGLLAAHISFARSGDYIALMAYLEPTPAHDEILADVRRRLRHATTRAATLGYGPRFLHSTGQFHKGGPADGIFIQITVDDALDQEIPGLPFSFSILKQAQAAGDQQAIMQRELPFVRLHIKGDIPAGMATISEAVKVAEEKHF